MGSSIKVKCQDEEKLELGQKIPVDNFYRQKETENHFVRYKKNALVRSKNS